MNIREAFVRNPNGSWTCISGVTIDGPSGRINIGPGLTFMHGVLFMGFDLASWLDSNS